ncbi:MAG TPA: hypothetical protein VF351_07460 [Actinomycetota bacterium]
MRVPSSARVIASAFVAIVGVMTLCPPAAALSQDPDPSTWMANGAIHATARYGNVMFVGGTFRKLREVLAPGTASGSQVTGLTGLAAIDITTGAGIASFKPQLTAAGTQSLDVQALAVVGDTLYVGGQFSAIDGVPRLNLAAIEIDPATLTGSVDPGFAPTVGDPAGNLAAVEVLKILPGADAMYISGAFGTVDGMRRSKIAKLSYAGAVDRTFKPGTTSGAIRDLEWAADGQTIFAGGNFTTLSGASRLAVGRLDAATGAPAAWAVPGGQIPSSNGKQICWDIVATATRLFAGCGKGPNFVGAFRVDTGDVGSRTWQYGTGGNVQAIALLADGDSLATGGHFGINSHSTYNGLMRVCFSRYLRALGVLRNINQTSTSSVVTSGAPSATTAYLDCGFTPNFEGQDPDGPNFPDTNPFGGVWEIQVTGEHLWALGEFKYVNAAVRRAIARFPL